MPNIKGVPFSIGADPEIFLKVKGRGGKFKGAFGVTQGTKANPELLPWPRAGCALQVDGFALEFNTNPVISQSDFEYSVMSCKRIIQKHYLDDLGLRFATESTAEFEDEEWERAPEENKRLGCDPDYSAYTLDLNPTPDQNVIFRTAAGHIHIGWGNAFEIDSDHIKVCGFVAKELDATLGLASLLFDPDTKRRSLYGKAGAFRPKSYGVEYRVLSNRWIKNSSLVNYVYCLSSLAIMRLMYQNLVHTDEVQDIINSDDKSRALSFLLATNCPLPPEKERIDIHVR